jgi:thiol-disulfide isomerase/thioredoxin
MSKKYKLPAALSLMLAAFFMPTTVQAYGEPDMYVVMFRSDTCPPCRIVEPNLHKALTNLSDPRIEYVTFDRSNRATSLQSEHRAFDRSLVRQYNKWLGMTGFAAIIDGDTKRTLGCVNVRYDVKSMTQHIRNLKTYADANQANVDLTCPEANNPVASW